MWLAALIGLNTLEARGHLSTTTGHTSRVLLCIVAEIYGSQMGNIVKLWFALFAPWSLLRRLSLHVNAFRRFFVLKGKR